MKQFTAQTKISEMKSFLRLLLVVTLVFLPIQGLMADLPETDSVNVAAKGAMPAHISMNTSSNQHDDHHVASIADGHTSNCHGHETNCHGHKTVCGAHCATFDEASIAVLVWPIVGAGEYQQLDVPLTTVILVSKIRPPIIS